MRGNIVDACLSAVATPIKAILKYGDEAGATAKLLAKFGDAKSVMRKLDDVVTISKKWIAGLGPKISSWAYKTSKVVRSKVDEVA